MDISTIVIYLAWSLGVIIVAIILIFIVGMAIYGGKRGGEIILEKPMVYKYLYSPLITLSGISATLLMIFYGLDLLMSMF